MGLPFPQMNGQRDNREYALVARVATARFSQNGPLKMEKRDALQTGACALERLSGSIGIERCYLIRDAIYTPQSVPGRSGMTRQGLTLAYDLDQNCHRPPAPRG